MFNRLTNRLEVRQLRYFVGIVEARSLTRAAALLNIAQPALSQQMAQLEEILGVKLLDRSRLGVQPTQAGHALYGHAQAILRLVGETGDVVAGNGDAISGRVRLALPSSLAMMLAPALLRCVRERHPGIKLEIYESPSGYLAALLLDERVDMSILVEKPTLGTATLVQLLEERLFFVTAASSPADRMDRSISLQEAAEHPLVLTTRATTLRQILDREFEHAGVVPEVYAEVSSIPTMLWLVEDGLGGTIVPGSALARVASNSWLSACAIEPAIRRTATLAISHIASLSLACKAVQAMLVEVAGGLVTARRWPGARITPRDAAGHA